MTTNEVLTKQNFITKIVLKDGDKELSKDLKIKVMKARIEYGKIRKSFDDDLQTFVKDLAPARFNELQQKPEAERTEEENKELDELTTQINSDYNAYIIERGKDEANVSSDIKFTEEEYGEIVDVCAGVDVEINGQKLNSTDFLEIIYNLFVTDFE